MRWAIASNWLARYRVRWISIGRTFSGANRVMRCLPRRTTSARCSARVANCASSSPIRCDEFFALLGMRQRRKIRDGHRIAGGVLQNDVPSVCCISPRGTRWGSWAASTAHLHGTRLRRRRLRRSHPGVCRLRRGIASGTSRGAHRLEHGTSPAHHRSRSASSGAGRAPAAGDRFADPGKFAAAFAVAGSAAGKAVSEADGGNGGSHGRHFAQSRSRRKFQHSKVPGTGWP